MLFIFGITIGFVIGLVVAGIAKIAVSSKNVGNLRIDRSDPDGPFMFLELKEPPRVVEAQEYVTLKVIAENYISQK